jgi:hypothetical protein
MGRKRLTRKTKSAVDAPIPPPRLASQLEPAQEEPTKKQVLDRWSKVLEEEKPTTIKLLMHCCELLDSPHLIQGPLAPYIYLILQSWRAKTRVPKHVMSGKEVADLVAYFVKGGARLTQARKLVAELLGRTEAAVTQIDLRYRKARRGKPQ